MDMDEAKELRERWKAKGSPPCDHPTLDREYYVDKTLSRSDPHRSNTGDKVCTTCGEDFSPQELHEMGR